VINIPGYSVSGEIGRGGMAVVHRARQVLLDREVALKVLNPQLAQDPVYAQRFLQEARMLASLGHPHIVPVYDVGVTPEGLHYFSMQLFGGGDFAQRMKEGIDEVELVRVLLAVGQALGFAHARGYVHRDVTPCNILFDERNRPVLTDFGIARALAATSRITASGLSIGTSQYMSPEQARGQEVDRRSDIYSLGVLLFEALVGKPPFEGDDGFAVAYAHVHEPVPRLPEGLERWQPLIDRAMAKNPDERYADTAAFIDGLRSTAPNEFAAVLKKEGVALATAAGAPMAAPKPAAKPAAAKAAEKPVEKPAEKAKPSPKAVPVKPAIIADASGKPNRVPLLVGAALVLVGLGLVGAFWLGGDDEPGKPAVAVTSTPDKPIPKTDPTTTAPIANSGEAAGDATVLVEGADPAAERNIDGDIETAQAIALGEMPTVEDPVVKLLAMGRANLAAQRISSPPGNNALDRYKLVLRIEPNNADAKAGIAAVAQAYVDLAAKQDPQTAEQQWLDYLVRAETIARDNDAAAPLAAAQAMRRARADELVARGAVAAEAWDRDTAFAEYNHALAILPDYEPAKKGLREAEKVGQPGYVFRDLEAASGTPELVVVDKFAMARRETTVGEFRAYWRAAGQKKFGGAPPSCRDRESFFRSSRSRTWEKPGHEQSDKHPVVCVTYAMAEGYAAWLSERTGEKYRLPSASEWRAAAGNGAPGKCTGNIRDEAFRKDFGGREGADCSDGFGNTAPTARFAARKPGLYDVDGNVREWVRDCDGGNCRERMALGASWLSVAGDPPAPTFAADTGFNTIGFRVLRELD
jgi:serine/threonine-protein kinase PpkA